LQKKIYDNNILFKSLETYFEHNSDIKNNGFLDFKLFFLKTL